YGRQKGHTEIYRGTEYAVSFLPKLKVEVAVPSDQADKAVEAITAAAKTGQIGDGKIFVFGLEQAVRIRTRETDTAALYSKQLQIHTVGANTRKRPRRHGEALAKARASFILKFAAWSASAGINELNNNYADAAAPPVGQWHVICSLWAEFTKADQRGSQPKSQFSPPTGEANPSPFGTLFT